MERTSGSVDMLGLDTLLVWLGSIIMFDLSAMFVVVESDIVSCVG